MKGICVCVVDDLYGRVGMLRNSKVPLDCNVLFFDWVVATDIISFIKLDSNWYPDGIIFSSS